MVSRILMFMWSVPGALVGLLVGARVGSAGRRRYEIVGIQASVLRQVRLPNQEVCPCLYGRIRVKRACYTS